MYHTRYYKYNCVISASKILFFQINTPFDIQSYYNLYEKGIQQQSLKSHLTYVTSNSILSVDETNKTINLFNTVDPTLDQHLPNRAEAAINHPTHPTYVVLRIPQGISIMDVATRKSVAQHQFQTPQTYQYWNWFDEKNLIFVANQQVCLWNYEKNQVAQLFALDPQLTQSLQQARITNVQITKNFCTVQAVGITQDRTLGGYFQLYSIQQRVSSVKQAYASCLFNYKADELSSETTVLCLATKSQSNIIDIQWINLLPNQQPSANFPKHQAQVQINPSIADQEFPLYLTSDSYNFIYMSTKQGYFYVFDSLSGIQLYNTGFNTQTIYQMVVDKEKHALLACTDGNIYRMTIDSTSIIDYIATRCGDQNAASALAIRCNLPGAENVLKAQFESIFTTGDYQQAALFCLKAKQLRNDETLKRFEAAPVIAGKPAAILTYIQTMLRSSTGLINEAESIECIKQLSNAGKLQNADILIRENKVHFSEKLGDLLQSLGQQKMSFQVYNKAGCHDKCILQLIQQNKLDAIIVYIDNVKDYKPDYSSIIQKGLALGTGFSQDGIDKLKEFCMTIIKKLNAKEDKEQIVNMCKQFANSGYSKEASWLLLQVIQSLQMSEDSAPYQTELLKINLQMDAKVAEILLSKNRFQYFDRKEIAQECEKAGLYQRAFEYCDDDAECIRIAKQYGEAKDAPIFESVKWYQEYMKKCGRFSAEHYQNDKQKCAEALFNFQQQMLDIVNSKQERIYAMHVAAAFAVLPIVATNSQLIQSAVEVFNTYGLQNSEALFAFLTAIFPSSYDPQIHLLYLTSALSLQGHESDLLKIVRESTVIDPQAAFEKLISVPGNQQIAVALCALSAKHKYSQALVNYLCSCVMSNDEKTTYYRDHARDIIQQYIQTFAPKETDIILSTLFENGVAQSSELSVLDSVFSTEFLASTLADNRVRDQCDLGKTVDVCINSSKTIKIIKPLLLAKLNAGATDSSSNTAYAKVLIETRDSSCEAFLLQNQYYDKNEVINFCIDNDQRRKDYTIQNYALKVAVIGAFGNSQQGIKDMKLAQAMIELGFGYSMYRELSTILIKRGDSQMWQIAMVDKIVPNNQQFVSRGGQFTLHQHREQLAQAVAENTNVQLEVLDPLNVTAYVDQVKTIESQFIQKQLMLFLERVILTPHSIHVNNSELHNQLILAAIKADETQKVQEYIRSSSLKYNADMIAKMCIQIASRDNLPEYYSFAFEVYNKAGQQQEASKVLIEYMGIDRAEQYANEVKDAKVFSLVCQEQIRLAKLEMNDNNNCMNSYGYLARACKNADNAANGEHYDELINTVFKLYNKYIDLYPQEMKQIVSDLQEVLTHLRSIFYIAKNDKAHVQCDTSIMYAMVLLDKFDALEAFLQIIKVMSSSTVPNKGDVMSVADKAYQLGRYQAAKMLYTTIDAFAKLALTLIQLQEWSNALDAARRANDIQTYRYCNASFVIAGQFALAKSAALNLIIIPEQLENVCNFYLGRGLAVELIEVLEAGSELQQAKSYRVKETNIFTKLACLYAKYSWLLAEQNQKQADQKLIRFLRSNNDKISVPMVINECKKNELWNEAVYLYSISNEYDQAIQNIIVHPLCFDHKLVLQICGFVSQTHILVDLAQFYIQYYPSQLLEFLNVSKNGYYQAKELIDKKRKDFVSIDPMSVLDLGEKYKIQRLLVPYYELLIEDNIVQINNVLVQCYIEMVDSKKLIQLFKKTNKFDQFKVLAQLIDEKTPVCLRKAACTLYSLLKQFDKGITYAINNQFYDEACGVALNSGSSDKCEKLLREICQMESNQKAEIFALAVSKCGKMVRPDVVLELSWINKFTEYTMPYYIGQLSDLYDQIKSLQTRVSDLETQNVATQVQSSKIETQWSQSKDDQWNENWQ